jgi:NDP-sugar pyrophosphorylase family protein
MPTSRSGELGVIGLRDKMAVERAVPATKPATERIAGRPGETVLALIMAGGRSERMRSTYGGRHKAMIEVGGTTLFERNLGALLTQGFRDITVVTAGDEAELSAFVRQRAHVLGDGYGARVATYTEELPLGNIGVVGELGTSHTTLVVYVDNVTTLDAHALVEHHRRSGAAMTLAAHRWPLRNAFGELTLEAGFVTSYREKPVRQVFISSGTCVVSPAAAMLCPAGLPFGASDLVAELLRRGNRVAAFEHAEPWIDVNDAASVAAAESLVRENADAFARLAAPSA